MPSGRSTRADPRADPSRKSSKKDSSSKVSSHRTASPDSPSSKKSSQGGDHKSSRRDSHKRSEHTASRSDPDSSSSRLPHSDQRSYNTRSSTTSRKTSLPADRTSPLDHPTNSSDYNVDASSTPRSKKDPSTPSRAQRHTSFSSSPTSSQLRQHRGPDNGQLETSSRAEEGLYDNPPGNTSLSSHVPDQFPTQAPLYYSTPAFGAAADYYGDQGESVHHQPGVRPHTPIIHGGEQHLMAASAEPAPPEETGYGTAAEFYAVEQDQGSTHQDSGYSQSLVINSTQSTAHKPSADQAQSPSSHLPAYAVGAAGVSAGALALHHQQHHPQRPHPRPSKVSVSATNSSDYQPQGMPVLAQHESRSPISKFVEWWIDYEDVRKMEEYTEYIGICKYCFDPHSSPYEAPRQHRPWRKSSRESLNTGRVAKERRYQTADMDLRRKSSKKRLAAGVGAGIGAGLTGYTVSQIDRRSSESDSESRSPVAKTKIRRQTGSSQRNQDETSRKGTRLRDSGGLNGSQPTRDSRSTFQLSRSATDSALGGRPAAAGPAFVNSPPQYRHPTTGRTESASDNSSSSSESEISNRGLFGSFFSPSSQIKKKRAAGSKTRPYQQPSASSSSSDTGLAYGQESQISTTSSKKARKAPKSAGFNAQNALLGLGAAAAVLAARDSRWGKKEVPDQRLSAMGKKRPSKPSDDEWESAGDDESDMSSQSSSLAFGSSNLGKLPNAHSSAESISSASPGSGKWNWRWGSKNEKGQKRRRQAPGHNVSPSPTLNVAPPIQLIDDEPPQAGSKPMTGSWRGHRNGSESIRPVVNAKPQQDDFETLRRYRHSQAPLQNAPKPSMPIRQPQPMRPVKYAPSDISHGDMIPVREASSSAEDLGSRNVRSQQEGEPITGNADMMSGALPPSSNAAFKIPENRSRPVTDDQKIHSEARPKINPLGFAGAAAGIAAGTYALDEYRRASPADSASDGKVENVVSVVANNLHRSSSDDEHRHNSPRLEHRHSLQAAERLAYDNENPANPEPISESSRAREGQDVLPLQDEVPIKCREDLVDGYLPREKPLEHQREALVPGRDYFVVEYKAPSPAASSGELEDINYSVPQYDAPGSPIDPRYMALRGVPRLNVITPTPPQSVAGSSRSVRSHSPSPIRDSTSVDDAKATEEGPESQSEMPSSEAGRDQPFKSEINDSHIAEDTWVDEHAAEPATHDSREADFREHSAPISIDHSDVSATPNTFSPDMEERRLPQARQGRNDYAAPHEAHVGKIDNETYREDIEATRRGPSDGTPVEAQSMSTAKDLKEIDARINPSDEVSPLGERSVPVILAQQENDEKSGKRAMIQPNLSSVRPYDLSKQDDRRVDVLESVAGVAAAAALPSSNDRSRKGKKRDSRRRKSSDIERSISPIRTRTYMPSEFSDSEKEEDIDVFSHEEALGMIKPNHLETIETASASYIVENDPVLRDSTLAKGSDIRENFRESRKMDEVMDQAKDLGESFHQNQASKPENVDSFDIQPGKKSKEEENKKARFATQELDQIQALHHNAVENAKDAEDAHISGRSNAAQAQLDKASVDEAAGSTLAKEERRSSTGSNADQDDVSGSVRPGWSSISDEDPHGITGGNRSQAEDAPSTEFHSAQGSGFDTDMNAKPEYDASPKDDESYEYPQYSLDNKSKKKKAKAKHAQADSQDSFQYASGAIRPNLDDDERAGGVYGSQFEDTPEAPNEEQVAAGSGTESTNKAKKTGFGVDTSGHVHSKSSDHESAIDKQSEKPEHGRLKHEENEMSVPTSSKKSKKKKGAKYSTFEWNDSEEVNQPAKEPQTDPQIAETPKEATLSETEPFASTSSKKKAKKAKKQKAKDFEDEASQCQQSSRHEPSAVDSYPQDSGSVEYPVEDFARDDFAQSQPSSKERKKLAKRQKKKATAVSFEQGEDLENGFGPTPSVGGQDIQRVPGMSSQLSTDKDNDPKAISSLRGDQDADSVETRSMPSLLPSPQGQSDAGPWASIDETKQGPRSDVDSIPSPHAEEGESFTTQNESSLPMGPTRTPSATAVPLRFRRWPDSPGTSRDNTKPQGGEITQQTTPIRTRSSRPNSTEFKGSSEFRPLYLVEANRKVPEIDESLPSLPSSHTTSRTSSVHDSEEGYESALESQGHALPPPHGLGISDDGSHGAVEDTRFLDSGQTTPRAGAISPSEEQVIDDMSRLESQIDTNPVESFSNEQATSKDDGVASPSIFDDYVSTNLALKNGDDQLRDGWALESDGSSEQGRGISQDLAPAQEVDSHNSGAATLAQQDFLSGQPNRESNVDQSRSTSKAQKKKEKKKQREEKARKDPQGSVDHRPEPLSLVGSSSKSSQEDTPDTALRLEDRSETRPDHGSSLAYEISEREQHFHTIFPADLDQSFKQQEPHATFRSKYQELEPQANPPTTAKSFGSHNTPTYDETGYKAGPADAAAALSLAASVALPEEIDDELVEQGLRYEGSNTMTSLQGSESPRAINPNYSSGFYPSAKMFPPSQEVQRDFNEDPVDSIGPHASQLRDEGHYQDVTRNFEWRDRDIPNKGVAGVNEADLAQREALESTNAKDANASNASNYDDPWWRSLLSSSKKQNFEKMQSQVEEASAGDRNAQSIGGESRHIPGSFDRFLDQDRADFETEDQASAEPTMAFESPVGMANAATGCQQSQPNEVPDNTVSEEWRPTSKKDKKAKRKEKRESKARKFATAGQRPMNYIVDNRDNTSSDPNDFEALSDEAMGKQSHEFNGREVADNEPALPTVQRDLPTVDSNGESIQEVTGFAPGVSNSTEPTLADDDKWQTGAVALQDSTPLKSEEIVSKSEASLNPTAVPTQQPATEWNFPMKTTKSKKNKKKTNKSQSFAPQASKEEQKCSSTSRNDEPTTSAALNIESAPGQENPASQEFPTDSALEEWSIPVNKSKKGKKGKKEHQKLDSSDASLAETQSPLETKEKTTDAGTQDVSDPGAIKSAADYDPYMEPSVDRSQGPIAEKSQKKKGVRFAPVDKEIIGIDTSKDVKSEAQSQALSHSRDQSPENLERDADAVESASQKDLSEESPCTEIPITTRDDQSSREHGEWSLFRESDQGGATDQGAAGDKLERLAPASSTEQDDWSMASKPKSKKAKKKEKKKALFVPEPSDPPEVEQKETSIYSPASGPSYEGGYPFQDATGGQSFQNEAKPTAIDTAAPAFEVNSRSEGTQDDFFTAVSSSKKSKKGKKKDRIASSGTTDLRPSFANNDLFEASEGTTAPLSAEDRSVPNDSNNEYDPEPTLPKQEIAGECTTLSESHAPSLESHEGLEKKRHRDNTNEDIGVAFQNGAIAGVLSVSQVWDLWGDQSVQRDTSNGTAAQNAPAARPEADLSKDFDQTEELEHDRLAGMTNVEAKEGERRRDKPSEMHLKGSEIEAGRVYERVPGVAPSEAERNEAVNMAAYQGTQSIEDCGDSQIDKDNQTFSPENQEAISKRESKLSDNEITRQAIPSVEQRENFNSGLDPASGIVPIKSRKMSKKEKRKAKKAQRDEAFQDEDASQENQKSAFDTEILPSQHPRDSLPSSTTGTHSSSRDPIAEDDFDHGIEHVTDHQAQNQHAVLDTREVPKESGQSKEPINVGTTSMGVYTTSEDSAKGPDFDSTVAQGLEITGFEPIKAMVESAAAGQKHDTPLDSEVESFKTASKRSKKRAKKTRFESVSDDVPIDFEQTHPGTNEKVDASMEPPGFSEEMGVDAESAKVAATSPDFLESKDQQPRATTNSDFDDIVYAGLEEAGFNPNTLSESEVFKQEEVDRSASPMDAIEFGDLGRDKRVELSDQKSRTPSPTQAWQAVSGSTQTGEENDVTKDRNAAEDEDEAFQSFSRKRKNKKKFGGQDFGVGAALAGATVGTLEVARNGDAELREQSPVKSTKKSKKRGKGWNFTPFDEVQKADDQEMSREGDRRGESNMVPEHNRDLISTNEKEQKSLEDSAMEEGKLDIAAKPSSFSEAGRKDSFVEDETNTRDREHVTYQAENDAELPGSSDKHQDQEEQAQPTDYGDTPQEPRSIFGPKSEPSPMEHSRLLDDVDNPSPVDSTTKNRASYLFTSPPHQYNASYDEGPALAREKEVESAQDEGTATAEFQRSEAAAPDDRFQEEDDSRLTQRHARSESSLGPPREPTDLNANGRDNLTTPKDDEWNSNELQQPKRQTKAYSLSPAGSEVANTKRTYMRAASDARSEDDGSLGRPHSAMSNRSMNSGVSNRSLRRADTSHSSDLRAATNRDSWRAKDARLDETSNLSNGSVPLDQNPSNYQPLRGPGKDRRPTMGDSSRVSPSPAYEGMGEARASPRSPTKPPSIRKRQSSHILDLESRLERVMEENRSLQQAQDRSPRSVSGVADPTAAPSMQESHYSHDLEVRRKDVEISTIKASLRTLQDEVARLSEHNKELQVDNENLTNDSRYANLQAEHSQTQQKCLQTFQQLQALQHQHTELSDGMEDIVRQEIAASIEAKDAEINSLRSQLDQATDRISELEHQILSTRRGGCGGSLDNDYLNYRDEDYFDSACAQLCQHVQQWVLRFSKVSDGRAARPLDQLRDDKIETRVDNSILDGTDVDLYLADRVRRRDVLMSVVMSMIWEFVFTRYLFGMDREQRQKLKSLEKTLGEVGPGRATTLTLLSRRDAFARQRAQDTDAVAAELFRVLERVLPPPVHAAAQLRDSLRNLLQLAVDLAIDMRTQRAEYVMLPPLQPEYDTSGDLKALARFDAALMHERTGEAGAPDQELEDRRAVVRLVLFPIVVRRGDEDGVGADEDVCYPAQVVVARPDYVKSKGGVGLQSNKSAASFAQSSVPEPPV